VSVETILTVIGFAAKHSPAVAEWLGRIVAGDAEAIADLSRVMPVEHDVDAWLRAKRNGQ
jgi:hypothetical protein